MDTAEKLEILSGDSRYDLACACGGGKEEHRRRGPDGRRLYPVALGNGRYTTLFKTLLSNACANDCKYCPLRAETNARRCALEPEETAETFLDYFRKGKASGLFLVFRRNAHSGPHDGQDKRGSAHSQAQARVWGLHRVC